MTRAELHAQFAVLLGGRRAEEIVFGEVSTGRPRTTSHAPPTSRARMVTEYGMSDALGAVSFDTHSRNRFLDVPLGNERGNYAEETARQIDAEVRRIVSDAHQRARALLADRRESLERVTRKMLEKEVIEGDELRAILDGVVGLPDAAATAADPAAPPEESTVQKAE